MDGCDRVQICCPIEGGSFVVKIKIISNPYQKQTSFQYWNAAANTWKEINEVNNDGSDLVKVDVQKGFFPFQVQHIVDTIWKEYGSSQENLDLTFEGPGEEYACLQEICGQEQCAEQMTLQSLSRRLKNGGEVWSEEMRYAVEVQRFAAANSNWKMEADALDDFLNTVSKVPICVLGDNRTGKSTFVNGLIGAEILPAGEDGATSKIYKIQPSVEEGKATLRLQRKGKTATFRVTSEDVEAQDCDITGWPNEGGSLVEKLRNLLEWVNQQEDVVFSDLVEINVPFSPVGELAKSNQSYVIFDAAGSSSAADGADWHNLQTALDAFSGIMPVVVTDVEGLDQVEDNFDDFLTRFEQIDALDRRFTMLVVNKADTVDLRELDTPEHILEMDLPYRLHPAQVCFVSSVMGLGAKNGGIFLDSNGLAELFARQQKKYAIPSSRRYTQLYLPNILPIQRKTAYDAAAQQESNLLYVNSGLYHIEKALADFACNDSLYHKCTQVGSFMENVRKKIEARTNATRTFALADVQQITKTCEDTKNRLAADLTKHSKELETSYQTVYENTMKECARRLSHPLQKEELEKKYETAVTVKLLYWITCECLGIPMLSFKENPEIIYMRINSFWAPIFKYLNKLVPSDGEFKEWPAASAAQIAESFDKCDLSNISDDKFTALFRKTPVQFDKKLAHMDEDTKTNKETVKEMVDESCHFFILWMDEIYDQKRDQAVRTLSQTSINFWDNYCNEMIDDFLKIIFQANILTEEQRSFEVKFRPSFDAFVLHVLHMHSFMDKKSGCLKKEKGCLMPRFDKIANYYNNGGIGIDSIPSRVESLSKGIQELHKKTFREWVPKILIYMIQHIEEYSPSCIELKKKSKEKRALAEKADEDYNTMCRYQMRINDLTAWVK